MLFFGLLLSSGTVFAQGSGNPFGSVVGPATQPNSNVQSSTTTTTNTATSNTATVYTNSPGFVVQPSSYSTQTPYVNGSYNPAPVQYTNGVYTPAPIQYTNGIYNPSGSAYVQSTPQASCSSTFHTFSDILNFATCVMNRFLLTIAISFATLYFVWGVVQYVLAPSSVEERKKSKQVMLWGILSLFVIVSVWGIVEALRKLLGI